MIKQIFALLLMATPAVATDLAPMTCIPHGVLADEMKARGAVVYTDTIDFGRKLEIYRDPKDAWISVVVFRPTGLVTKNSCSVIFGVGDPGVAIPATQPK